VRRAFEKANEIAQEDLESLFCLGMIYLNEREDKEAINCLCALLQYHPEYKGVN